MTQQIDLQPAFTAAIAEAVYLCNRYVTGYILPSIVSELDSTSPLLWLISYFVLLLIVPSL